MGWRVIKEIESTIIDLDEEREGELGTIQGENEA